MNESAVRVVLDKFATLAAVNALESTHQAALPMSVESCIKYAMVEASAFAFSEAARMLRDAMGAAPDGGVAGDDGR
jgi:hypothetical protein